MNFEQLTKLTARANQFLDSKTGTFSQSNLHEKLKKISSSIVANLDPETLQSPQVRQLISLGTCALSGDGHEAKVATACLNFFDKEFSILGSENFSHLLNCCVDRYFERTDKKILRLLPENFSEIVTKYLDELPPLNNLEDLSLGKQMWVSLENLRKNPNISVALKPALSGLMTATKMEGKNGELARKAISYLVLEKDLIDDSLGIFGLADDIFVIEETASKLGLLKFGQSFLIDLKTNNSVAENFFFEERGQLLPLGPQIKSTLKSIHFANSAGDSRLMVSLPEVGPMALLQLINNLISNINISKEDYGMPSIGQEVYFKVLDGYVSAKFDGYREIGGQTVPMLGFTEDKFSTLISVNEETLRGSLKSVPKNSRIFKNQKSFVEKQKADADHLPRHIAINSQESTKEYVLYTQKKHFLKFYSEMKPFGVSSGELFSVTYRKANGGVEYMGNGPINLSLCSDENTAKECIDEKIKDRKKFDLIVEHSSNVSGLISLLSDWHLDKINCVTCYLNTSDYVAIEELEQRNFKLIYLNYAFADMEKRRSGARSSIRSYEHFLTETSQAPKFNSNNLFLPTIDEFHYLFKELFIDNENLDFRLQHLLSYFRDHYIWDPLPIENERINALEAYKNRFIDEFRFQRTTASEIFIEFIQTKWTDLLDNIHSRSLLEAIENSNVSNLGIFARTNAEKTNIRNFLAAAGVTEIEVFTQCFEASSKKISSLLVPVPPSKYKRQQISDNKVSNDVILNFTHYETEIFEQSKRYKDLQKQTLFKKSAKVFGSLSAFEKKTRELKEENQAQKIVETTDLTDIELKLIKSAQRGNDPSAITNAYPLLLTSRNEYILVPQNAKLFCYNNVVASFELEKPDQILEGSVILLQKNASKDFVEELAESLISDHTEMIGKAGVWRENLRQFREEKDVTISELKKLLESKIDITKTATTIRMWLANEHLVAPDDYQIVLPKINAFLSEYGLSFSEIDCINAVSRVYNDRRTARHNLSEYFLSTRFENSNLTEDLTVELSGKKVSFSLKEVAGRSELISVPYSQVWKINSLRGFNEPAAS